MSNELKEWKVEGPVGLRSDPSSQPSIGFNISSPDACSLLHFRAGDDTLRITGDAVFINDESVTEIGPDGIDIIRRAILAAYQESL